MPDIAEKIIDARPLPSPVRVMRSYARLVTGMTGGDIYGEVHQSRLPSETGVTYDFYVGVVGKPFRHKLLSAEFDFYQDYPVRLYNHEAGNIMRLYAEVEFEDRLKSILSSAVTQNLLGRLRAIARDR